MDKDRRKLGWTREPQDVGYRKLRPSRHDTVGWLHSGDGTDKPNFDKSAPWRKPDAKLRER